MSLDILNDNVLLCILVKNCGDPGNVPYSTKAGTYFVNDTVTYTCVTGFETLQGQPSGTTYCGFDTIWTTLPNCTCKTL